jgi:hypothetical protein
VHHAINVHGAVRVEESDEQESERLSHQDSETSSKIAGRKSTPLKREDGSSDGSQKRSRKQQGQHASTLTSRNLRKQNGHSSSSTRSSSIKEFVLLQATTNSNPAPVIADTTEPGKPEIPGTSADATAVAPGLSSHTSSAERDAADECQPLFAAVGEDER